MTPREFSALHLFYVESEGQDPDGNPIVNGAAIAERAQDAARFVRKQNPGYRGTLAAYDIDVRLPVGSRSGPILVTPTTAPRRRKDAARVRISEELEATRRDLARAVHYLKKSLVAMRTGRIGDTALVGGATAFLQRVGPRFDICECGKPRSEHEGMAGHGAGSDACTRFTWSHFDEGEEQAAANG